MTLVIEQHAATVKAPYKRKPWTPPEITPLGRELRTAITTREAAIHLSRAQQTLRKWAMNGDGPVKPVRVQGRLMWSVADLKAALGVSA